MKLKYNELIFDLNGDVNLDNYYTKSECDNKYALKSHSHNISDITNLQSTLNGKSNTNHTHSQYATTSAVTNAQNTANNALNVANSKSTLNKSHGMVTLPEEDSPSLVLTSTALLTGLCPGNFNNKMGNTYIDGTNIVSTYITYDKSGIPVSYNIISGIGLKNNTVTYDRSLRSVHNTFRTIGTYI